jgi:DNA-binding NarL/FixJ family response regulator
MCSDTTMRSMGRTMLIVDDHEGFRVRARALFAGTGYQVIGEAHDVASGIRAIEALSPRVVLLDIQLPDGTGFEVAERVRETSPPPTVVLTSSRDAADYGARIERSGARGFIGKADLSVHALDGLLEEDP